MSSVDRYEKGKSFERRVGDLFDLMDFDKVEYNLERETAGNEIDIFLKKKKRLGDKYEYYICECKAWEKKVGIDIVNKFNYVRETLKLELIVKKKARDCEAIIVSPKGFTEPAKEAAETVGMILYTYEELLSQVMNFNRYLTHLVQNYERGPLERLYVNQDFYSERHPNVIDGFQFVEEWLQNPDRKQFSLLGDYGTGKTTFAKALAYEMAIAYKEDPSKNRIPFLIDLKDCKGTFKLKSLIKEHLENAKVEPADSDNFLKLLAEGQILLIFDSFDEMAVLNSKEDTLKNFKQLNKVVSLDAKVILISRAHYFKNRDDEERVLKKQDVEGMSELSSMLFRKISKKPAYEIVHLKEFSDAKVRKYLQKAMGEEWEAAYRKIESIYNLYDLSRRPLLLNMIVSALPELEKESKIFNLTHLYEICTKCWPGEDYPRLQIPEATVVEELLEGLACNLWKKGSRSIHYSDLSDMISERLKKEIKTEHDREAADKEMRTASFLVRDEDGNYSFAHESFKEFFIARNIKKEFSNENFNVLDTNLFSNEVVFFLTHLVGDEEPLVRKVSRLLETEYSRKISENALFIFYTVLKITSLKQQFSMKEAVELSAREIEDFREKIQSHLPEKFDLRGAVLCEWVLPYMVYYNADFTEVYMRGADFSGSTFKNVRFEKVKAHHCNFKNCRFENCTIEDSDFCMSNFMDVEFNSCTIKNNDFTGAGFCRSSIDMEILQRNTALGVGVLGFEKVEHSKVFVDQGHGDIIRTVAVSKDGRFMVSGSDDKAVKLWDMESGRLINTFEGHDRAVLSVFISPDNRWIVSGSSDRMVKLWDTENGCLITTFKGHKDWVNSVLITPDNRRIVSGSSDHTVKLWDFESRRLIKTLKGHERSVLTVFAGSDDQRIVSVSSDNTVKVWSSESGQFIKTIDIHGHAALSSFVSRGNRWIVSSGYDKKVKLWDMESGGLSETLDGHNDWVRTIFISHDNRWIVSGSDDKTVKLWDLKNENLPKTFEGHGNIVSSIFITPDNRRIVSGSFDETIKVWDIESGRLVRTLKGNKDPTYFDITNPENEHRIYYRDRMALYPSGEFENQ